MTTLADRDRAEIEQLIYRFALGLDTGDVDLVVGTLTDDAEIVLEAANGRRGGNQGKAALVQIFSTTFARRSAMGRRRHLISNVVFLHSSADVANTSCYVTTLRFDDGHVGINTAGVYSDTFLRTESGWLMKRRIGRFDTDELIGTAWIPE